MQPALSGANARVLQKLMRGHRGRDQVGAHDELHGIEIPPALRHGVEHPLAAPAEGEHAQEEQFGTGTRVHIGHEPVSDPQDEPVEDGAGDVFHTYSSYARGLDMLIGAYNLDLMPKGRTRTAWPSRWPGFATTTATGVRSCNPASSLCEIEARIRPSDATLSVARFAMS
jgi:hypothetical protein